MKNMYDYTKPDVAGMDFGKPTNRRSPHEEAKQRQPFTDYEPIKDRPGWEHDGCGHERYDGLPDAQQREREGNKREASLALAQVEQTPLAVLQAFNDENDAQDFGPNEERVDAVWDEMARAFQVPKHLLAGQIDPQALAGPLSPVTHRLDNGVDYNGLQQQMQDEMLRLLNSVSNVSDEQATLGLKRFGGRLVAKHIPKLFNVAKVEARTHQLTNNDVVCVEMSDGSAIYTKPIAGTRVCTTTRNGRGAVLVVWEPEKHEDWVTVGNRSHRSRLIAYLNELRTALHPEVKLLAHTEGRPHMIFEHRKTE